MESWFGRLLLLLVKLITTVLSVDDSVIWRKVTPPQPLTIGHENWFPASNTVLCVFGCSMTGEMPLAALDEGRCFCFRLNRDVISTVTVAISSYFVKTTDSTTCVSNGYTVFPGLKVCIKYSANQYLEKWKPAQLHCNQDGGYLMEIDNQNKLNMAMSLVNSDSALIYIGAFTNVLGQDFQQIRGGVLDLQLFVSGEPDSTPGDYCVGISKYLGVVRGMVDISCQWDIDHFCELLL